VIFSNAERQRKGRSLPAARHLLKFHLAAVAGFERIHIAVTKATRNQKIGNTRYSKPTVILSVRNNDRRKP
jgi:hypothetical protein